MTLKKVYDRFSVIFTILGNELIINDIDILESLINSLIDMKFINKKLEFNELIKIQQKTKKYILVDTDMNKLDELKILSNMIYNFLLITKQHTLFFPESITVLIDDKTELTIYSTEKIDLKKIKNCVFSPTIRSEWNNPVFIENIIYSN